MEVENRVRRGRSSVEYLGPIVGVVGIALVVILLIKGGSGCGG
jgi:hypothetical protein